MAMWNNQRVYKPSTQMGHAAHSHGPNLLEGIFLHSNSNHMLNLTEVVFLWIIPLQNADFQIPRWICFRFTDLGLRLYKPSRNGTIWLFNIAMENQHF